MLVHEILEQGASRHPGRTAVVSHGHRLSYRDLADRVVLLADALSAAAAPGDRIAVLADNCAEYLEAYYAVPKAGMVMCVLNQRLHAAELAGVVESLGVAVVFGQERFITPLLDHRAKMSSVRHWVGIDGGGDADYATFTSTKSDAPLPHVSAEDIAWVIPTSGTTGRPKSVMLSHSSLLHTMRSTISELGILDGDSFLFPLPLCHIGGYLLPAHHLVGGTVVLEPRFTPQGWLDLVAAERPTTSALAPTMISMLLESEALDRGDLSSLRWILYGASSIPRSVLVRAMQRLGVELQQGYGGTEMGGFVCTFDGHGHALAASSAPDLLTSAGRPMRAIDLKVVGPDMREVAAGEVGEIVVRGPQVMAGYWQDPEATDHALRGGWLHTGDLARVDDRGYVHVVDRMNDMIVTGGENVYPREVEDVIHAHPGVLEAAVFGVPDDRWVQAVASAVVRRPGSTLTSSELDEFCRARLASFKLPRHVQFTETLPKNATGKILRSEARAQFFPTGSAGPQPTGTHP